MLLTAHNTALTHIVSVNSPPRSYCMTSNKRVLKRQASLAQGRNRTMLRKVATNAQSLQTKVKHPSD